MPGSLSSLAGATRPAARRAEPDAGAGARAGTARPGGAEAGEGLLFLREEQLRNAQELLFFAWRDLARAADPLLEERGLGRAHHRALCFIGNRPGLTVGELLELLLVTKQSLARVLGRLIGLGYVRQSRGESDRRQRRLSLTDTGRALETRLFERQRERLVRAFRGAGAPAVDGFRTVLHGLSDDADAARAPGRDAASGPHCASLFGRR